MNLTQPTAGTKPWNLDDLFSNFNAIGTEVEAGRGTYGSLNLRFEGFATTFATKTYVNAQIASGGIDYSTYGSPLQTLRLNAAGDTPEGYDPSDERSTLSNLGGF